MVMMFYAGFQSCASNWSGEPSAHLSVCDAKFGGGANYSSGEAQDDADAFGREARTRKQGRDDVQAGARRHSQVRNRRTFQGRRGRGRFVLCVDGTLNFFLMVKGWLPLVLSGNSVIS